MAEDKKERIKQLTHAIEYRGKVNNLNQLVDVVGPLFATDIIESEIRGSGGDLLVEALSEAGKVRPQTIKKNPRKYAEMYVGKGTLPARPSLLSTTLTGWLQGYTKSLVGWDDDTRVTISVGRFWAAANRRGVVPRISEAMIKYHPAWFVYPGLVGPLACHEMERLGSIPVVQYMLIERIFSSSLEPYVNQWFDNFDPDFLFPGGEERPPVPEGDWSSELLGIHPSIRYLGTVEDLDSKMSHQEENKRAMQGYFTVFKQEASNVLEALEPHLAPETEATIPCPVSLAEKMEEHLHKMLQSSEGVAASKLRNQEGSKREGEDDRGREDPEDPERSISDMLGRAARSSLAIMEDLNKEFGELFENEDDPGSDLKDRLETETYFSSGEFLEVLNFIEEKMQATRTAAGGSERTVTVGEIEAEKKLVLEGIARIEHADGIDIEYLENIREKARSLIDQMNDLEGDFDSADAEAQFQPFKALWDAIQDPSVAKEHGEVIRTEFGTPMLVDVSQGQLKIGEVADEPEPSGEVPADEPEPSGEVPADEPEPSGVTPAGDRPKESPTADGLESKSVSELAETIVTSRDELESQAESDPDEVMQRLGEGELDFRRQALIWKLIAAGDYAIAYWVATYPETSDRDEIPRWLLRTLAISRSLESVDGSLAGELQELIAVNQGFTDTAWSDAPGAGLLTASALLRPAVFMPSVLVTTLLKDVSLPADPDSGINHTYELLREISDLALQSIPIRMQTLRRISDFATPEAELDSIQKQAESWILNANSSRLQHQLATDTLRKWAKLDGLVGELLDVVINNDTDRHEWVKNKADNLEGRDEIKDLVKKSLGRDISHRVSGPVERKVRDALGIIRSWMAYRPSGGEEHSSVTHTRNFKKVLGQRGADAIKEMEGLIKDSDRPLAERSAAQALHTGLIDTQELFGGHSPLESSEPELDFVFSDPLLLFPKIRISGLEDHREIGELVLRSLSLGRSHWTAAFEERLKNHDMAATSRMLDTAPSGITEGKIEELANQRAKKKKDTLQELRGRLDLCSMSVERAGMDGVIGLAERLDLQGQVEAARRVLLDSETEDFRSANDKLSRVETKLTEEKGHARDRTQARLEALDLDMDGDAARRISKNIKNDDIHSATELISRVEAGFDIAQIETGVPEKENHLSKFFPGIVDERAEASDDRLILNSLRTRRDIGSISFGDLTEDQGTKAVKVIENWLRTDGRSDRVTREVLELMGFNVLNVTSQGTTLPWFKVETEPVRDRSSCPVPEFGSAAAGQVLGQVKAGYRVLWIPEDSTAEDIVRAVGITAGELPTFVFYTKNLDVAARRALARLCREKLRIFLLIDTALLLYVCSLKGGRMRAMFSLALPFTFVNPFTTTAGLVPPEVFYGREEEYAKVIDPFGPNIIYGGRQLGKTALLKYALQSSHSPNEGKIAVYLNLQMPGIGTEKRAEEVWPELGNSLRDAGLEVRKNATQPVISRAVKNWLDQDGARKILVLMDEADGLFETDEEFKVVAGIKGLMDVTNRRFKVVFAGLHNVQRMTRVANNPLAHLGEPIVIGPLYENGEWQEAYNLIREPLKALGYEWESDDLITRILARTNHYPSLIQIYGSQLLRFVSRKNYQAFDPASSPPFVLTSEHIDGVYNQEELRDQISDRFKWTLDLDPRYRLIAYLIAYETYDEQIPEDGLAVSWIRKEAVQLWPVGFQADSSEDTFGVLLDEMVGLGVLASTGGRYRLRNQNIGLLMGTKEEILNELVGTVDRPAPPEFEAGIFRRRISANNDGLRSAMTTTQEGRLVAQENGVTVIFGCAAGGMLNLQQSLSSLTLVNHVPLEDHSSKEKFLENLDQISAEREEGVTLVFVSSLSTWDLDWVTAVEEKTRGLRASDRFLRVVFVADPQQTRALTKDGQVSLESIRHLGVSPMSLHPWLPTFRKHWLEQVLPVSDMTDPPADRTLEMIDPVAGCWPGMLQSVETSLRARPLTQYASALSEMAGMDHKELFGLGVLDEQELLVLGLLSSGETSESELSESADVPRLVVQSLLSWLDCMGLVTASEGGRWRSDPILGRLIN